MKRPESYDEEVCFLEVDTEQSGFMYSEYFLVKTYICVFKLDDEKTRVRIKCKVAFTKSIPWVLQNTIGNVAKKE